MQVSASSFKAYDIRGVVGRDIDEAFAEHLGRAFGSEAVRLGERAVAVGRDGRLSGPVAGGGAGAWPGLDRARRGRPRRRDHADAVLRGRHPRPTRLQQRHRGDRQPQPEGLQRLQDGARRQGDLRRRDPGPAPAHRGRRLRARARPLGADEHPGRVRGAHHRRLQAGAADEDRGRFRQRHSRRVGARHPARAGLRRDRAVFRGRRQLPEPPPRPEPAREPGRADPHREAPPAPNSAWPSTATATASAWSPKTARSSTPTAS